MLRFRHDVGDVDAFLWPTLRYVFLDWLDLLKDVLMTGQPVRSGFRIVALAFATTGLVRWKRRGEDRVLPLALLVWGGFALSYVSGYSTILRQTQPYRNLGPAVLAAGLVGAALVAELVESEQGLVLERNARAALTLAAVIVLPHLGRTVLGFMPTLLPRRDESRAVLRSAFEAGAPENELPLVVMGHDGPSDADRAVARYLERPEFAEGRVAVLDWVLGEYLAAFTRIPTLGGIAQRNVPHVAAHPLRHDFRKRTTDDDPLARYVKEYAVTALVTAGPHDWLDARSDLMTLAQSVAGYRVYRVKPNPSYFAEGSGRIASQNLNSIRVTEAVGPSLVLRFHWLETLRCRPNCVVEKTPAEDDGAGFIRIEHPPSSFEIYNAY